VFAGIIRRKVIPFTARLMTIAHLRPILSVIEPAIRDELRLITALMEIKLVIVVKGRVSSSLM
jgi:hypothetical protein